MTETYSVSDDIAWEGAKWACLFLQSRGICISQRDIYYMHMMYRCGFNLHQLHTGIEVWMNQWEIRNIKEIKIPEHLVHRYEDSYNAAGAYQVLMKQLFLRFFGRCENPAVKKIFSLWGGTDVRELAVDSWGIWEIDVDYRIFDILGVLR